MKKILYLLFLIVPFTGFSQKIKKEKEKMPNGDKAIYYVLKDSAQIKHGAYEHYDSYDNLIEKGFYKMGERDSIWEEYFLRQLSATGYYRNNMKNGTWKEYRGKNLSASGEYVNGQKTGNWNIYNSKGKVEQIYNYSTGQVTGCDSSAYSIKQRTQKILIGKDSVTVVLDRPVVYIGGEYLLFMKLNKNVRYPQLEKEKNIQGTVFVSFYVDTTGKASNFRVTQGVSPGLDKEALRAFMLINDNWSPAIYKGNPVGSTATFPVTFILY